MPAQKSAASNLPPLFEGSMTDSIEAFVASPSKAAPKADVLEGNSLKPYPVRQRSTKCIHPISKYAFDAWLSSVPTPVAVLIA